MTVAADIKNRNKERTGSLKKYKSENIYWIGFGVNDRRQRI